MKNRSMYDMIAYAYDMEVGMYDMRVELCVLPLWLKE